MWPLLLPQSLSWEKLAGEKYKCWRPRYAVTVRSEGMHGRARDHDKLATRKHSISRQETQLTGFTSVNKMGVQMSSRILPFWKTHPLASANQRMNWQLADRLFELKKELNLPVAINILYGIQLQSIGYSNWPAWLKLLRLTLGCFFHGHHTSGQGCPEPH